MSLEMAHKVIVPQKKIISHSFLNSGTLIVIILFSAKRVLCRFLFESRHHFRIHYFGSFELYFLFRFASHFSFSID
jgi:hypothetical protein